MTNAAGTSMIRRTGACAAILFSLLPVCAQRLPGTIRPERYALTLIPDLKAATYTGTELIDVTLAQPATAITLNAREITFKSAKVSAGGREQTASVSLDKDRQQATLTVPLSLQAGKAVITIEFAGTLNNELRGFYLSTTPKRNYAVTQLEAVDARRAFPCFDEPAMKASFDVALVVDAGDTAISNSPIASDSPGPGDGKHTLKFETTPRMSTYLLAFLVGDFQCTPGQQDGVAIRVCSTPDKVGQTSYGVDVAKFVLHYYNNYFGIPYPLKKLDLIALPDFEAGAMENFGAITYREDALLLNPATASLFSKKEVALVIAHEMAHQWFGDLVTMQWWDNIWLNEGFASWMENKPVAAMHPEWNIDQAVISNLDGVLNLDALPTTRTIRARADTPDEINQMFDGITYGKAGAVLLTIENYLGEEAFRQGVHNYLAAHLNGNATAEDFWNAQTATSHKPVDKIMESLVAQPGAPILAFGESSGGKAPVTQKRFFLSPVATPDPATKWTMPVCFKETQKGQMCDLLAPTTTSLNVPGGDLFFAHAGGSGYFRTSYPGSIYKNLVAHAEDTLGPSERIRLMGDEWAQIRSGGARVSDFLSLVSALRDDSSSEVIGAGGSGIDAIYARLLETPADREAFAAWIRATYGPELKRLGDPAPGESPNTTELRAELFYYLGRYGKDPAVVAQARELANKYLADPGSVDPTLSQSALDIAARNGDSVLFDKLRQTFETSANPELQQGSLHTLGLFEDPELAKRSMDYALSVKVRNQDSAIQLMIALGNPVIRDYAWNFIKANWDKIQPQLTTSMGGNLVESTASFCSTDARDDVKHFFAEHKVPSSSVGLTHAVERIDGCIEFRKLQQSDLRSLLAEQSGH
jgi:aminopeptidase N/puromycin-sensitive aminopeptidase